MKAYLSISFGGRKEMEESVQIITNSLKTANIETWIFVDQYLFKTNQEKKMMQQALADIDACDFLIAETSIKGIGIGIEVGYAKAKGKTVVYIRNKKAELSTTVSGISDYQIVYASANELRVKLNEILPLIKQQNHVL